LQLPIASAVNRIVNEGGSIDAAISELWAHPIGRELVGMN
jgi:hypothetical protein